MKSYLHASLIAIAATVSLGSLGMAQPATAVEIIGLTMDNNLVAFDSAQLTSARKIQVSGVDGNLIGIDVRPANQKLYGVTDTSKIYTIDPTTGAATMVSSLSKPFKGGLSSGVDFNPVADRLRLVAGNGQNFRINVETGATTVDKPLKYAKDDQLSGKSAGISAGAYTNSMAGAKTTQLFNIDGIRDALVLQNPPNDGVLKTVGMLGTNFSPMAGMDIMTDASGTNTAFAVSGSTFYSVDLEKGAVQRMGNVLVDKSPTRLIDVAAMSTASTTMPKP
ncbi:DUF4394 domain-containing protein [Leptolyngbya sp. FACHB-36]|uniref:DUF4394 domain-containing protein n=1 Tax=Leptolyngbya sp. FACHB-36 TaxID=2692808 RepID=UPI0016804BBC|nr:DUF4394 domain-containing protein [Leptolyngbya sp. FACHB-36]MBD2021654.1 DUF4394 domain-containing protein [Leptolyngbya sp. FACHB-36]